MEVAAVQVLTKKASNDFEWVQQAISGNQKAYEYLMNRHRGAIFHQMYKMTGNTEDAHDLTIEAFGKAFVKLPSYEPRFAFSTWLYKIASNNCIDFIRKKKVAVYSIDVPFEIDGNQHFASNLPCEALNPEEAVIKDQRKKMTRGLVAKLGKKYRLMIELRYFQELSYQEISKELGVPLGTVKAQLFRAKEILLELLEQSNKNIHTGETTRTALAIAV